MWHFLLRLRRETKVYCVYVSAHACDVSIARPGPQGHGIVKGFL